MLNIKYLITLLSTFLITLISAAPAYAQSSVWQATKDGKTVYIAGSIHLLRSNDYPLPIEFNSAIQQAKTIYIEADITAAEQPEIMQRILQRMLSKDGALNTKLSKTTQQQLNHYCQSLQLPCQSLYSFSPAWASVTLSVLAIQRLGFDPKMGIEEYVLNHAKKNNKAIYFLESIDEQLNAIDSLNTIDSNLLFRYTLEDLNDIATTMNSLVKAWRVGDSRQLNLFNKSIEDFPEIYAALLSRRNMNWAKKVPHILKQHKQPLIIVGVAHLVGKNNLLELLKKQGFSIKFYQPQNNIKKLNKHTKKAA